ncbi:hypothetical protein EQW76_14870 [Rhizobium sp. rho-13.1]|nr:hypothetical protein EQW76_14870 [Rhizobium sp. rho-13.1]
MIACDVHESTVYIAVYIDRASTRSLKSAIRFSSDAYLSDDAEIELNGQKVTLKELKEGHLRHADYTRKTQELAEKAKFEDSRVEQLREASLQYFQNLEREIAMVLPHEPNWAQLSQDDPVTYVQELEKWKQINAHRDRLRQEQNVLQQQAAQKQAAIHAQNEAQGRRNLAQMHPELAKPETGKASQLSAYLEERGIPREAIEKETNATMFSMAYESMLYRQMQSQKAQAVKKVDAKPLLTTPGSSLSKTGTASKTAFETQMGKFKRTGSREDAANVLKHLL